MEEQEFRADAENFVNWLARYLDTSRAESAANNEVLHQWTARSDRAAPQAGAIWSCKSLFDAYQNYYWKTRNPLTKGFIFSYTESAECLAQLGEKLRETIENGDAKQCLQVCEDILRWGGVQNRPVASLIRSLGDGLPRYLKAVEAMLNEGPQTNFVVIDGKRHALEVDSGTTKIYSLLSTDWAIYDGRVGAALGWLVRRWAEEMALAEVPERLRFAWGYEPRRNPNVEKKRTFPMFGAGVDRFQQNLRLNCLLRMILEANASSQFMRTAHPLRALEAALFMIGYSVREHRDRYGEAAALDVLELEADPVDNCSFAAKISARLRERSRAAIPKQNGGQFNAEWSEEGVIVDCLGPNSLLPWRVFDEVERLLDENVGNARRGNAMGGTLGDALLPFDSVEGRIAEKIYGRKQGDAVFRRISPIANILVWAGVCEHETKMLCKAGKGQ
ncbi:hypothetical protein [Massilia agri]|uniref:Uncharacterized protein n=1 Tax=Massilia agri TaxID=1886785 RepID=A0ABT2ANI8_9BURK|nr:hypothetical protein [Massilia agri]MCS0597797.1 hypothetical protein [Massilia agri]